MSEVTNNLDVFEDNNLFSSAGIFIPATSVAELAVLKEKEKAVLQVKKERTKQTRERKKKDEKSAKEQEQYLSFDVDLSAVPEHENIHSNASVLPSQHAQDEQIERVEVITEEPFILNARLEDLVIRSLNDYGQINIDFIVDTWDWTQESDEIKDRVLALGEQHFSEEKTQDFYNLAISLCLENELLFLEPKLNALDSEHRYLPLDSQNTSFDFVTREEFLSGKVRFKLAEYEANSKYWNYATEEYIDRATSLLAEKDFQLLPLKDINPLLGEIWIPEVYMRDFARDLLDEPSLSLYLESHNNEFSTNEHGYIVNTNNEFHSHINIHQYGLTHKTGRGEYSVKIVLGSALFEHAINGTAPVYSYTDPDTKKKIIDNEATLIAGTKIDQINEAWTRYMFNNTDIKEHLERIYNNTYNIDVGRQYDGSHLNFSSMQGDISLHAHQKNAIWQIACQNGGLVDHVVGAGKTLVMAGLSAELQRLEISKRVMIICKKSTVGQIAKEIHRAYPDKKILMANDKTWAVKGNFRDTALVSQRWGEDTALKSPIIDEFGEIIGYPTPGSPKFYVQLPYIDKGLYLSNFLYNEKKGKGDMFNSNIVDNRHRVVVSKHEFFIDQGGKIELIKSQEDIEHAYESLDFHMEQIKEKIREKVNKEFAEKHGIIRPNDHALITDIRNTIDERVNKDVVYELLQKRQDEANFYKISSLSEEKIEAYKLDEPLIYHSTNREVFINQVLPYSDHDIVLLTHHQFKELPEDLDLREQILDQQLEMIEDDLEAWSSASGEKKDKRKINSLEKRQAKKKEQIQNIYRKRQINQYDVSFSGLNIDHLMVDESQVFKNLEYTTRFENVAGLGNTDGSDIAFQLLLACRSLQQKNGGDKGITFLTGTPLSNSLTECYTLFRFLRPSMLAEHKMMNFDSWIRTFSKASFDFEINILSNVAVRTRFRNILKVPELASMYRSFSNVVMEHELKIDKPLLINREVPIAPTPFQEACLEALKDGVESFDLGFFGKISKNGRQNNGLMLQATSLAKKISLDVRMLDLPVVEKMGQTLKQSDGSKVEKVCNNVSEIYHKTHKDKGTQLVFLDISTPKDEEEKGSSKHSFSMYHEIKATLIGMGVPKGEIAFIHDVKATGEKGDRERLALFDKFNRGEIRVLLGSTEKMGTGVNVQARCCAIHHVDLPWTFALYQQRLGRAVRQGNIIAPLYGGVLNYIYGMEKSLDAFNLNLIEMKGKIMAQVRSNRYLDRTLDEGAMDSEGGMSAREFAAQLSGNADFLELNKLEKERDSLLIKDGALWQEHGDLQKSIQDLESSIIPKLKHNTNNIAMDVELSKNLFSVDEKNKTHYTFTTNKGTIMTDQKNIQQFFHDKVKAYIRKPSCKLELGTIGDFRVVLEKTHESIPPYLNMSFVSKTTDRVYAFREGKVYENTQAITLFKMPYNTFKELPEQLERYKNQVIEYDTRLVNERAVIKTIDINRYTDRLDELKAKILELNTKMIDTVDVHKLSKSEKVKEMIERDFLKKNNLSVSSHRRAKIPVVNKQQKGR